MKELAVEIEAKREKAKKDKAENKKIIVVGKQAVHFKDGKKVIVPSKVIYQDVKESQPMDEEKMQQPVSGAIQPEKPNA